MRVAVMGTGGTGGYFGGLLARAGEQVTFIARGQHLAALRRSGLTVRSRLVGDFTLPVEATDELQGVEPVDLVLFCVKAHDTETAAELVRPVVGDGTIVLPLQNGIDAAERVGRVVGEEHMLGGVAFITAHVAAPGTIEHTGGAGKIIFGEPAGGTSARTDRLLQTFAHAGIPAEAHPAIWTAIWEKFVFICAFGGITALTRLPIGPILASGECRRLFEGVMREVVATARCEHVDLPDALVERGLAIAASFEPWATSSLFHDLEAGRRLELEALNGTVTRLARTHGLSTPLNFAVYAALHPYLDGAPAAADGDMRA